MIIELTDTHSLSFSLHLHMQVDHNHVSLLRTLLCRSCVLHHGQPPTDSAVALDEGALAESLELRAGSKKDPDGPLLAPCCPSGLGLFNSCRLGPGGRRFCVRLKKEVEGTSTEHRSVAKLGKGCRGAKNQN